MPTYEYECTKCGYRFDAFQNMNDAHLKSCPKCKKGLKRLIGSGSGIIFKEKKKEITCPKIKEGCRGCS